VSATAPKEADVKEVPVEGSREGDGTLQLGTLLPKTGSLAFLGPPEFAGLLAEPTHQTLPRLFRSGLILSRPRP